MMKVTVYVGSITDPALGAHAIVNAANASVALGSGVSGAIREACGPGFQQEVRERLEEQFDGNLEAGNCLVTGPGEASAFRWVLHVPAVDFHVRDPETGGITGPARVRACFRSALEEALRLAGEARLTGRFVLATALLGAGVGGLGVVVSADVMMGELAVALRDWSAAQREVIDRVVFAVLTAHDASLVRLAAEKHGVPFGR